MFIRVSDFGEIKPVVIWSLFNSLRTSFEENKCLSC